jgi:hypothetical protein
MGVSRIRRKAFETVVVVVVVVVVMVSVAIRVV